MRARVCVFVFVFHTSARACLCVHILMKAKAAPIHSASLQCVHRADQTHMHTNQISSAKVLLWAVCLHVCWLSDRARSFLRALSDKIFCCGVCLIPVFIQFQLWCVLHCIVERYGEVWSGMERCGMGREHAHLRARELLWVCTGECACAHVLTKLFSRE